MNQEYKEKLSRKIENNYSTLEERIMQDIVRRIKKTGKITSTADWQINRLMILGNSSEDIENMLKETLDASYPEMFELYDKVIDWEYVRNKDIYEQINAKFIPYDQNKELQQITDALIRQTKGEMENITQSLGFYLDYGNGNRVLTPLAEVYQNYLDNACMDIASGAFSYNEVLRRTVTQLTNSGLRTIEFASGRAYRVNVAARMAVMTGISQLTGHISDMNAEKLGTEHFEVAWHGGARPEHSVWQGKVWTKEQLKTVCGLGTVTGLLGVNCYHEYYPFIPGISERNWSDEWLEEQNQKENTPKEWFGREYTTYEAKQKQRQMETAMRAQRQKVKLLQEGDADPDEVMLARCKYQAQLDEYARFSKKMGLKQERERIYLDGRGRVAPIKKTIYRVADTTDKWAREARKELFVDEKSISKRTREVAVIYDSKGNFVFTKRGDEKGVNFTKAEGRRMKGCIVSHNHPSGASFSIADWILFKTAQLEELRAVSGDKVYYLRKTKDTVIYAMNDNELEYEFRKIRKKVRMKYQKMYEDGIITKTERHLLSSEEYNKIFAQKCGLEYGEEGIV